MEDKEYWENDMIKTLGLTREQWLGDEPVSPQGEDYYDTGYSVPWAYARDTSLLN